MCILQLYKEACIKQNMDTNYQIICYFEKIYKNYKIFDFSNFKMGNEGLVPLLNALTEYENVEKLILKNNDLQNVCGPYIENFIKLNKSLLYLDISYNNISYNTGIYILSAIQYQKKYYKKIFLKKIILKNTRLSDFSTNIIGKYSGKYQKFHINKYQKLRNEFKDYDIEIIN
eukprot:GHVL01039454.1.p2 GENE.GHVL01039454.1~~GHVL01039454.1.p2  ORF type:complete len:202 (+),score=60.01 GHVL01039454.1:90-608(+)